ncbi:MAG: amidohydrolase family protein [Candidatus Aminicenantes bacterium]|nr:amidohydrolase family protein [Candidatus Aminicenantes bacterium]
MRGDYKFLHFFIGLVFLLCLSNCAFLEKPYDLVIKNGIIIDGTGNPWFKSDIGLKNKKIVKIGLINESHAKKSIDASNLIVSPGFIDIHTHCDRKIAEVPTVDNYIYQGVTTVIGGNCGGHPFPLKEHFKKIEDQGVSVNFGCLIGHNTIRRKVMSFKMEAPTEEEMEKMKALVDEEMKAGALGFSTGLSYLPGIYSETEELVQLASVVSRYGGIYATHLRDQGSHITEAIEEAIEIGERNKIPVQIAHIKLADDAVWFQLERITGPVEEARKRGVEVTLDQYPYTATSSGFTSSLPSWAFEGGKEKFLERLEDKEAFQKIKSFVIKRRLNSTKGINKPETIYIARSEKFPEYEGKNLQEILLSLGKKSTTDNAADLIVEIEKNGGASGVFFQMDEKDVEGLMGLPYNMHASDGGIRIKGEGTPHPRNYGTFPRVIAHYVRERGIIPLEEAVRKMTSLPAQTLRLNKRGIIKEGLYADLTIFDKNLFTDKATYPDPHQYSQGLMYVIVNGELVVEQGKHNGGLPGMVLYGYGKD